MDPTHRGERFPADATLHLAGTAFDDRFAALGGKHLRWFAGREPLGHGAELAVSGLLAPGKRLIRLVATDRFGRKGSAAIQIQIKPAVPRFILVRAPKALRRRATKLKLRLATSIPARLQVRGQHFKLNRRGRTIKVRVARGKNALILHLELISARRRFKQTLRIPRK